MLNPQQTLPLKDPALLKTRCYIDGAWRPGSEGRSLPVLNPATGALIAEANKANAADARLAIEAAHRAFSEWSRTTAKERSQLLRRWYELTLDAAEDLAALMTAEQGKTLAESRVSSEMAPFGGVKASGWGREGSRYGMDDYLDIKYLCVGGLDH